MRREDTFVLSHRPYAVDLNSLDVRHHGTHVIRAVWFRRRRGVTVACIGELWDHQKPAPSTALEFLKRHDDGRYGGETQGRWDGHGYWGAESPDTAVAHLKILRPMLRAYPQAPPEFDGWWTFRKDSGR